MLSDLSAAVFFPREHTRIPVSSHLRDAASAVHDPAFTADPAKLGLTVEQNEACPVGLHGKIKACSANADRRRRRLDLVGLLLALAGYHSERTAKRPDREIVCSIL